MRHASSGTPFTTRRSLNPMFFMARTTAATLTRSCVSNNTMRMRSSRDSAILHHQRQQSIGVLPVTTKPGPVVGRPTEHQLAPAPFARPGHLVHDHVEADR